MTITIGDLVIPPNNTRISGFVYNNIKDWYSGAVSKTNSRPKPRGDGDFGVSKIYYGSLVVTIEGVYVGRNEADTIRAKNEFAGLKNRGRPVKIEYEDALGKTYRYGTVEATPIPHTNSKTTFTWAIDILCRDSKRYGEIQSETVGLPTLVSANGWKFPLVFPWKFGPEGANGRVTLVNDGKADAPVEIEITGGLAEGFIITDVTAGKHMTLNRYVPPTATIYLNSKNGSATINRESTVSNFLSGDWFYIPPGEAHTFQFNAKGAVTGTPLMTVRASSTFN